MTEKGKFSPHAFPIAGCSPPRNVGCLLALVGRYKPLTRLPFWLPSVIMRHRETTEQGSSLASCRVCHSFTQAHRRVSRVKQKTSILRKQRGQSSECSYLVLKFPDELAHVEKASRGEADWGEARRGFQAPEISAQGRKRINLDFRLFSV